MSAAQTREDVNTRCRDIEAYTDRLKRSMRRAFTYDSRWLDDVRAEALHIVDAACGILEIVGLEQAARLAQYDEQCGLVNAMYNVLYRDGRRDGVDNE